MASFKYGICFVFLAVMALGCHAKFTHLEFYFMGGAPNTSNEIVAGPKNDVSKAQFGTIFVFDDKITNGPNNQTSKILGRAQGIVAVTDVATTSATYYFTVLYQHKGLKGQLIFVGRDTIGTGGVSELAISGGTGSFRFASGYANFTYTTFLQLSLTAHVSATIYQPGPPRH